MKGRAGRRHELGDSPFDPLRIMGLGVMYFFPTRTDVLDFSRSRVSPLLAQNPFLSKLIKDTDTIGLKKIGESYLFLRGMESKVGIKSVPADMVVFDELDEANPAAKRLANERLAQSDYKRVVELSNPSLPNFGIDEAFQLSDQRHWTVRCDSCGTWTALDKEFPLKLGQEVRIIREREDGTGYRAGPRCDEELDLDRGQWVTRLAFAGDLILTTGYPRAQKFFAQDWSLIPSSVRRLQALHPEWVYPGHGKSALSGNELQRLEAHQADE